MGKAKAPPAPAPVDAAKASGEYLFGSGFGNYNGVTDPRLQNQILASEAQFRPQYAALELADINTYLLGSKATEANTFNVQELVTPAKGKTPAVYRTVTKTIEGRPAQMGALDLTAEATRRSSALDREAQSLQRQQEIDILGKYGAQTTDALRAADPYSRAIAEAQQQYAQDLYGKAGMLGMEDQRMAEQQARAQGLASGRIGDSSTIAAQALNRQNALAQRSQMAQQAGAQAFQYNRALSGDIANILIGRPSTAYGMGSQTFGQSANLAGQPTGPQLFDPNAGINLALQNSSNQGNYQSSIFGAKAGREGAIIGGIAGGVGALAGGVIGKYCWVAREVYGEKNPKWKQFRSWLLDDSPKWFLSLYLKYGERFAAFIRNKPTLKVIIRKWMDSRIANRS